jgi:phytol kinase
MLNNNWVALLITFLVALSWLRINNFAAHRGYTSSDLSRKIIHIGTGPLFVLCWLLFNESFATRYMAALVPVLITGQFILVGTGIIKDETAVQSMSRTGDRREILKGPLIYGVVFIVITIVYWKDNPIGIIALMLMCGGDGLADIIGRRYGAQKLPWNRDKSWVGSLGMFIGGWLLTVFVVSVYVLVGQFNISYSDLMISILVISIGTTIVESLPIKDFDNLTTTITALALGHIMI